MLQVHAGKRTLSSADARFETNFVVGALPSSPSESAMVTPETNTIPMASVSATPRRMSLFMVLLRVLHCTGKPRVGLVFGISVDPVCRHPMVGRLLSLRAAETSKVAPAFAHPRGKNQTFVSTQGSRC